MIFPRKQLSLAPHIKITVLCGQQIAFLQYILTSLCLSVLLITYIHTDILIYIMYHICRILLYKILCFFYSTQNQRVLKLEYIALIWSIVAL